MTPMLADFFHRWIWGGNYIRVVWTAVAVVVIVVAWIDRIRKRRD